MSLEWLSQSSSGRMNLLVSGGARRRAVGAAALLLAGCLGQVKPSEPEKTFDGGTEGLDGGADSGGSALGRDGSTQGDDPDGSQAGHDASTVDGAIPDQTGMVHVVVAVGRGGRSTISCDDGRTWIANRIETTPTARCWGQPIGLPQSSPDYLDCDHDTGNTTGLVFHRGAFFKSIGWGTAGRTLRSTDGVDWVARNASYTDAYLGLVTHREGLAAVASPWTSISTDEGSSWKRAPQLPDTGHVRLASVSEYQGETLVMMADNGLYWGRFPLQTYQAADANPCGKPGDATKNGLVSGGSVSIIALQAGDICTSNDGGKSWTRQNIAVGLNTTPVWDGQNFYVWGRQNNNKLVMFKSPNGAAWTSAETNLSRDRWESVGVTTKGSFVATTAVWDGGYEHQKFARSDDGVTWETLPSSAFVAGHPISQFASGVVPANLYCSRS